MAKRSDSCCVEPGPLHLQNGNVPGADQGGAAASAIHKF